EAFGPGQQALLGFVGIPPDLVPKDARPAAQAGPASGGVRGTVWLDFAPGGGGKQNAIDSNEKGLPGMNVQAVQGGRVVASATSAPDGTFAISGLAQGSYRIQLPASNFRPPWGGIQWLGATLVTPSIIIAWI